MRRTVPDRDLRSAHRSFALWGQGLHLATQQKRRILAAGGAGLGDERLEVIEDGRDGYERAQLVAHELDRGVLGDRAERTVDVCVHGVASRGWRVVASSGAEGGSASRSAESWPRLIERKSAEAASSSMVHHTLPSLSSPALADFALMKSS